MHFTRLQKIRAPPNEEENNEEAKIKFSSTSQIILFKHLRDALAMRPKRHSTNRKRGHALKCTDGIFSRRMMLYRGVLEKVTYTMPTAKALGENKYEAGAARDALYRCKRHTCTSKGDLKASNKMPIGML